MLLNKFSNKTIVMYNKEWISPNTIVGDAATGERYLKRPYLNEYIWIEVSKGNHILFVAPRRVGKTSIMKDLVDNCPKGYNCFYQNIEGVETKNQFYKRLAEMILKCASNATNVAQLVKEWWESFQIKEVGTSSVGIETKEIDYEEKVRAIIPALSKNKVHVVLFIDEFAEVINKLNRRGQAEDAIAILHTIREMRHDENFRHFTLVFAGSIGLHHVVNSIDRPKLINDLHRVEVGALTKEEAIKLVNQLTKGATIQYNDEQLQYLLQKTEHLLPYYIQLMLEEVDLLARNANNLSINDEIINQAFERVSANSANFEDWIKRLKDYQADFFPYINYLLKHIAHKGQISVQEVYNIAANPKYNREEDYMDFIDQLLRDGYLIEYQKHNYRFLSPFLKSFWLKKYPVFND